MLQHLAWMADAKHVQEVTRPIGELAYLLVERLPPGPERTEVLHALFSARAYAIAALKPRKEENYGPKQSL